MSDYVMMSFEEAVIHILKLCEAYRSMMHWQMTARIALASLYLDDRVVPEVRNTISELITSAKLPDYDHLLL